MVNVPSPAVSIVGRHNSGKTTLIVKLIEELVARGHDVGSVKHHSHKGFDIDYPGKDSYRHREAGASETVIAAPGQIARMKTLKGEAECSDIVRSMPGHDIVVVEGYRKSGLPTIELMRSGNEADQRVAEAFALGAERGWALGTDFTQIAKCLFTPEGERIEGAEEALDDDLRNDGDRAAQSSADEASGEPAAADAEDGVHPDLVRKMPGVNTVAIVTDIPRVRP